MRTALSVIFALVIGFFATQTSAQQAITLDRTTIKPGMTLIYLENQSKQEWSRILDQTTSVGPSGVKRVTDADGNVLINGAGNRFVPHSGYRPPGARGQLQVGMKWRHSYSINGENRTRSCRVSKSGTFKNRYISVGNAFLVKCSLKNPQYSKPSNEEIWFTPDLFSALSYKQTWTARGGKKGSFLLELIAVK